MRLSWRVALLSLAVTATTATLQAPAQADIGCSTTKKVPGVSVFYNYCDLQVARGLRWSDTSNIQSNHGGPVQLDTQMTLRIDGKDAITKNWTFVTVGDTWVDPYNLTIEKRVNNDCTTGHTYFPIVRLRVHGGSWGAWAGAGEFVCS